MQKKSTFFYVKTDFYKGKNIFLIWTRIYSDRFDLDFADETIRSKNFHLVESYDEKTVENYRNCYPNFMSLSFIVSEK